ncbi:dihydropteroate synthase [Actibacterium sp. 188UL27-1]|nr:dihydropteroate synthase [Actibacterium sp. 188UL27-1]
MPRDILRRLTADRPPFCGLSFERPRLMGILNVTPDSFSDGGRFDAPEATNAQARSIASSCDILDIGGESTRPGAETIEVAVEIERTAPVIAAIRATGLDLPISIDTRKAGVATAALAAGAQIVNDVSGLTFDPELAGVAARVQAPVILMHAQGTPQTMQDRPSYDDVLLDVYDHLAARIAVAAAAGIPRHRIAVDPGIGFGKTLEHNLALLRGLSLFHGLGCPILLGASRKGFIGKLGNAPDPADRAPGSIATALHAVAQGVQILRVHDTIATKQAVSLWSALT